MRCRHLLLACCEVCLGPAVGLLGQVLKGLHQHREVQPSTAGLSCVGALYQLDFS